MPHQNHVGNEEQKVRFSVQIHSAEEASRYSATLSERLDELFSSMAISSAEVNAIHTGLEELLTNIAKFGREGKKPEEPVSIEVNISVEDKAVYLTVSDNGPPFDPSNYPPPDLELDAMDRPIGGLGLFMLLEMFSGVQYERFEDRNKSVWFLKRGEI